MTWKLEDAEAIPFSREHIAVVIGIPSCRVNNWIDRNRLWQADRGRKFHRPYSFKEVVELGGFAAMRVARIPEKACARFVYTYGFHRAFLRAPQEVRLSFRNGRWDVGVYDPDAVVTLLINMRAVGTHLFERLALELLRHPTDWPRGAFESFRLLYRDCVRHGRLDPGSVAQFEIRTSGR